MNTCKAGSAHKTNYSGDFNLRHPLWNPTGYARHDEEADALLEMMAGQKLSLLLPPGTITYPYAGTRNRLDVG